MPSFSAMRKRRAGLGRRPKNETQKMPGGGPGINPTFTVQRFIFCSPCNSCLANSGRNLWWRRALSARLKFSAQSPSGSGRARPKLKLHLPVGHRRQYRPVGVPGRNRKIHLLPALLSPRKPFGRKPLAAPFRPGNTLPSAISGRSGRYVWQSCPQNRPPTF